MSVFVYVVFLFSLLYDATIQDGPSTMIITYVFEKKFRDKQWQKIEADSFTILKFIVGA